MVLYNITIKVDHAVRNELLDRIRAIADDSVRMDGIEQPGRVFRLRNVDESDGMTYCLQQYFRDMAAYNHYLSTGDLAFREEMADRFGDKMVLFASVLTEV